MITQPVTSGFKANAWPPGSAKFANARPPGLTRQLDKCSAVARGDGHRNNRGMHFGLSSLLVSKVQYKNWRRSISKNIYFSPSKAECTCVYGVRMLYLCSSLSVLKLCKE